MNVDRNQQTACCPLENADRQIRQRVDIVSRRAGLYPILSDLAQRNKPKLGSNLAPFVLLNIRANSLGFSNRFWSFQVVFLAMLNIRLTNLIDGDRFL